MDKEKMFKLRYLFIWFLLTVLIVSCSSTPKFIVEILANSQFDCSLALSEIDGQNNTNLYPFTLNYKNQYGCPVINITLNDKLLTFLVDTGSECSWIYDSGIQKIYGSVDKILDDNLNWYFSYLNETNPERLSNKNPEQIKKMLHDEVKKYNVFFTITHPFASFIYSPEKENIDGIIGLDYLKKYRTVTFDFINNKMLFDQERLNGSVIKIIDTDINAVFIEFSYKGNKEYGLIDTGNYTFSPRAYFGKDEMHFDFKPSNDYSVSYDGKIKKRLPMLLTFNDIKIGNIEYNNIKGVYSNIWFSTYNKGAQKVLQIVNGIGCELFRNHIIQFDFEEKIFIVL